ncbi:MAG: NnrU family protein, partial [Gammaproteobacteria bacterium]|nr:NnrU family protein [Gammaproteobacteria bacterium]
MIELIAGIILFFGAHSISIFALPLRDQLALKNEYAWKGIYSLISLAGIVLMVRGYGEFRLTADILYVSPIWLRHLSALILLPFFIFMLAPYFPSVINRKLKHPQLVAIKLWAIAHLLVNGSVADIMLFGAF